MLIRLTPFPQMFLIQALLTGDELTFLLEPHLVPELLRKAQNGAPHLILVTGSGLGRIVQNSQKSFPRSPGLGCPEALCPTHSLSPLFLLAHSFFCSTQWLLNSPTKTQAPASSSMRLLCYAWSLMGLHSVRERSMISAKAARLGSVGRLLISL